MPSDILISSTLETERFGFKFYKLNPTDFTSDSFSESLITEKPDIIICKIPTANLSCLNSLMNSGIPLSFSEPLIEFSIKKLQLTNIKIINKDLKIIPVTEETFSKAEDLLRSIFVKYSNHYLDNPFIKREKVMEAYLDWLHKCFKSGRVFLTYKADALVGFFSTLYDGLVGHGGPGGLIPEYEGLGIYSDVHQLIPEYCFYEDKIRMLKTSAKGSNVSVIKQWENTGWKFSSVVHVFHLCPFLGRNFKAIDKIPMDQNIEIDHKNYVIQSFGPKFQLGEAFQEQPITVSEEVKSCIPDGKSLRTFITSNSKANQMGWLTEV